MPAIAIPFICIFISLIFGFLGKNKKMGFWGYFFATLFLTPFIGAILLIVTDKKKTDENKGNETHETGANLLQ